MIQWDDLFGESIPIEDGERRKDITPLLRHMFDQHDVRLLLLENEYFVNALLQQDIDSALSEKLSTLISAMYKGLGEELYRFIGKEKPTQNDWVQMTLMLRDKGMTSDKAIEVLRGLADVLGFDGDEFEWSVDYQNRCGNCKERMDENARYCSFCGTPRGEGKFSPYKNSLRMYVLYGPMPLGDRVELLCEECGRKWETFSSYNQPEEKYCSQCGKICFRRKMSYF